MPAHADDVDARTRMAIAELRADFLALRDEINQWRAEVLDSVTAIAQSLARPSGSELQRTANEQGLTTRDAGPGDREGSADPSHMGGSGTRSVEGDTAGIEGNSIIALPEAKSNYDQLYTHGVHHRQHPLRLILRMFEAGAIYGTGIDVTSERGTGFTWKYSGMTPTTLRYKIRPMLEEKGFVDIPRRIPISDAARRGKAKRRADAAGPGYLTPKGEAVARYMKDNGITDAVLEKGRRRRT
jgi:hypothetical protein